MSTLYSRANAVIPIAAAVADAFVGKEGYFYKRDASNKAVVIAAATDIPDGLVLAGASDEISAAVAGGNHGTVRVKLGGNVTDLRKNLTLKADGTAQADAGSGARVVVAKPLQTGSTDELIEAILLTPVSFAS